MHLAITASATKTSQLQAIHFHMLVPFWLREDQFMKGFYEK